MPEVIWPPVALAKIKASAPGRVPMEHCQGCG
jgi:hypothetical protein